MEPEIHKKQKIAVIRGPGLNPYEKELYALSNRRKSDFQVTFVGSTCEKPPFIGNDSYCFAPARYMLPLTKTVGRQFSYNFVRLENLWRCLETAAIINTVEVFTPMSYQATKISKLTGKKTVITVWETLPHSPLHYIPPFSHNVSFVLKHADLFLAMTKRAARYLWHIGAPKEKVKILYPGIDMNRFAPPKTKLHNTVRVLFASSLIRHKGLIVLLKAFSRLSREKRELELWVAGRGVLSPIVKKFAERYPIRYLGFVDHQRIHEVYRKCDIFCLPSYDLGMMGIKIWEEQVGLVLLEAMGSGLPIVATNCGAIPEVIGDANLVVQQRKSDSLYNALRYLVENQDVIDRISKANRRRALRLFEAKQQNLKFERYLKKIL